MYHYRLSAVCYQHSGRSASSSHFCQQAEMGRRAFSRGSLRCFGNANFFAGVRSRVAVVSFVTILLPWELAPAYEPPPCGLVGSLLRARIRQCADHPFLSRRERVAPGWVASSYRSCDDSCLHDLMSPPGIQVSLEQLAESFCGSEVGQTSWPEKRRISPARYFAYKRSHEQQSSKVVLQGRPVSSLVPGCQFSVPSCNV